MSVFESLFNLIICLFFFFQAEDGIRDTDRSRGLGDVYKRQDYQGIYIGRGVGEKSRVVMAVQGVERQVPIGACHP